MSEPDVIEGQLMRHCCIKATPANSSDPRPRYLLRNRRFPCAPVWL
jgi:hypothetical protein